MVTKEFHYEKLEHKADTGFLVKAPSLERLYIHAAMALTDMIVPLKAIRGENRYEIAVTADSSESLMVKWLNEVLFLFERHKFLASHIVFSKFDGKTIEAVLQGDYYEAKRHGCPSEIKATTYHQLEIGDTGEEGAPFFAKVFLDL